jgi:hypothetical protein
MSIRIEIEKFLTIDENGKIITVTKTRTFERQTMLDGHNEEYEKLSSLSVPGLGHVNPIDDPTYQYQILKTGMKLRDRPKTKT